MGLCHPTPSITCFTGLATVGYEIDSLLLRLSAIHMKDSKASGCQRSLSFDIHVAFEGITYDGG